MDNARKIRLCAPAVLSLPRQDAEKLLAAGSGEAALLYIYILKTGGEPDRARAAAELGWTEAELNAALAQLAAMGIVEAPEPEKKLLPAQEAPEVSAEDIVRRTRDSAEWGDLLKEVQNFFGRILSTSELKTLFNIYDYWALPPEVIVLLINHCGEETARRYGPGKKPSFRTLENWAQKWVNQEIITYERAEQWLAREERRRTEIGQTLSALGIRDRAPTDTERRYIRTWLDMGFTPEALAEAYDRTVTNTGGLKWRYMDGIVRSWDQKGLHTPEQIRDGDKKPARSAPAAAASAPDRQAVEQMKKLREKMRNS